MEHNELLDLWRSENPSEGLYAENVAAIRVAVESFSNGNRSTPAGEHSAQLRGEFGVGSV